MSQTYTNLCVCCVCVCVCVCVLCVCVCDVRALCRHLFVCYKSICNWVQNELKRSTFILRIDQGTRHSPNSKTKANDTKGAWLSFCPLNPVNQAIKSFGKGQSTNQSSNQSQIKGFLVPVATRYIGIVT